MIQFYMVCERGELEIKSLLLVLSITQFSSIPAKLINVLVPSWQMGQITTLHELEKVGCNIIPFHNKLITLSPKSKSGDRVSNKLYFLENRSAAERMIFLDSDMLLTRSVNLDVFKSPMPFCAKQADRANVSHWAAIYTHFGLKMPIESYPCTVDGVLSPPYFNAGFINVHSSIQASLFNAWTDLFVKLSDSNLVSQGFYSPFNRDQVALALAVQLLGLKTEMVDDTFNFPARSKPLTGSTIFAHYHSPIAVWEQPRLRTAAKDLISNNKHLKTLVRENMEWSWVFGNCFTRSLSKTNTFRRIKNFFNQPK